jgi:hypothetical protein
MRLSNEWELVTNDMSTRRLKVPGGWLVTVNLYYYTKNNISGDENKPLQDIAMSFVPDPNHEWEPI